MLYNAIMDDVMEKFAQELWIPARSPAVLGKGTAAGIYGLRRLKIKRCGELATRALLALDFCLVYPTIFEMTSFFSLSGPQSWTA